MPTKGRGRPKAENPLRPITTNYESSMIERIARARARRQQAVPGYDVTTSDTIRSLLEKALAAEEQAESQAELPFTAFTESKTKKS